MNEHANEAERLDWTSLRVDNEFVSGSRLTIEGDAPVPMRVELHPLPIGIVPVDYQGVELRGFRGDFGPEVVTHFKLSTDMDQLPTGTVGVVIIGATMREYIPPKEA